MNSIKVAIGLVVACLAAFAFAFLDRNNNHGEESDE